MSDFQPEQVLLLCGDPADAVTRALLEGRARLAWPLVAVTMAQLLEGVEFGAAWSIGGKVIHPERTALVNRLPMSDRLEPGDASAEAAMVRQGLWSRLRRELGRFGYASSLPTASSLLGCFGSLLDQWQDLPRIVPGLAVPEHSARSVQRPLAGAVFSVNRWTLYDLGQRREQASDAQLPPSVRVDYVMPPGRLVHLTQVGHSLFFVNAPPTLSQPQQQAMVDVARALARVSPIRILEHAFFVDDTARSAPVLYSSCPVPVLSGGHPLYPQLVQQGLTHDIQNWRGSRRP